MQGSGHIFSEIYLHLNWHCHNDKPMIKPKIESSLHELLEQYCRKVKGIHFERVGGTETHVHWRFQMEPFVLLSDFVGKIKGGSSHEITWESQVYDEPLFIMYITEGNDMHPIAIDAPNTGLVEAGPWSVQLSVSTEPGTIGKIYAFSASPADGSIMAASSVNVTYGGGTAVESFIEITEPKTGTVIPGNPVTVIGTGGGLFEGNVVVQALDNNNNVLAEKATIIDSPDAGVGGQGPWTLQLHVAVKPGTPGKIYAFSPSPKDGSVDDASQVDVIFGEVDTGEEVVELEDHLWILER